MQTYEYKVVPAPKRGKSGKGVRGTEAKFAHALSLVMNEMGADGWDYVRSDILPCEERSGLTSRVTVYHNMLVFRRARLTAGAEPAPAAPLRLPAPVSVEDPSKGPDAAWEKFALTAEEAFTEQDPSVVNILQARKARSLPAAPSVFSKSGDPA